MLTLYFDIEKLSPVSRSIYYFLDKSKLYRSRYFATTVDYKQILELDFSDMDADNGGSLDVSISPEFLNEGEPIVLEKNDGFVNQNNEHQQIENQQAEPIFSPENEVLMVPKTEIKNVNQTYSIAEAAVLLKISKRTLYEYRKERKIRFTQCKRSIVFTQQDIDDFLNKYRG